MTSSEIESTDSNATTRAQERPAVEASSHTHVGKVLLLMPDLICPSASANRSEQEYATPEFRKLKELIAANGGNVQPIQARPLVSPAHAEFPLAEFEIVFGHRRHRACLELDVPVLAYIVDGSTDDDLLVRMTQENRERKSLSAYETGLFYIHVMAVKGFTEQKQLANFLKIDTSGICEALAVANLPDEILRLFPSRLALSYHDGAPLARQWANDEEETRRRIKQVQQLQKKIPLVKPQIVSVLLGKGGGGESVGSSSKESHEVYVEDEMVAVVSATTAGVTSVKFTSKKLSAEDRQWICTALGKTLSEAPFLSHLTLELP